MKVNKIELYTYNFNYDGANRISVADFSGTGQHTTSYSYDKNGNIMSLTREGRFGESAAYGSIDELTYAYNGNQLQSVHDVNDPNHQNNGFTDDGSFVTTEYQYDANGNMTQDLNKTLLLTRYNHLNLPQQIIIFEEFGNSILYLYDAAGRKLRKATRRDYNPTHTTDYVGSFVYVDDELQYLLTAEGRVVVDGSNYEYQYFLKDHLGNTRITFNESKQIIQEDSYYPYGMAMAGLSHESGEDLPNKYLYNGKELQDDFGLDWYDYGTRLYDAVIGRWHVVDNKAEKFYGITQYAYAIGNPLRFLDPDGNEIVDATGKPITYDAKNGWSSNATSSIKIIHESLMLTETGSQQWEKAYTSASKIEMNIVEEKLYSQKSPGKLSLGQTNQALGFDSKSATNVKTDGVMKIEISTGSISESFDEKNKDLTLRQAIGATAGHEIEHTTEENRDIGVQNRNIPGLNDKNEIEKKPNEIGRKIREESRNSFKRLQPIQSKLIDDQRQFDPSKGGFY